METKNLEQIELALLEKKNAFGIDSKPFAEELWLAERQIHGQDYVQLIEKWADAASMVKEYGLVWLSAADNVFLSRTDSQETNILKTKLKIQYMERALSIDPNLSCKGSLAKLKECLKEVECNAKH